MIDCLDLFNVYIMAGFQIFAGFYFYTGFLQKKVKWLYGTLFAVFGTVILTTLPLDGIWEFLAFILLLMAAGKIFWKIKWVLSVLYAVVAVEIMNLCFGFVNSLSTILFPVIFEKNPILFGLIFMGVGNLSALALSILCAKVIQRCCTGEEIVDRNYAFMILMPALLIFLVSGFINTNVYGNTSFIEKNEGLTGVSPYSMLFMQTLGIVSLFCIIFTYKKLTESFRLHQETALLEMQANFLNQYVEEVKLRYEKTKSFRHDIKNHVTVIKELLENQKEKEALQYVGEMEHLTADLSFPVSTNHPVLDIFLGNKLGIAKDRQIQVQCSMLVPYPCGIRDMDFCIILGNALDNAISACNQIRNEKQKWIRVTGKVQGDFLLMEIENSYTGRKTIRSGTGLSNIKAVAEKYHGAMEIKTEGEVFVLSVLVVIPQQGESISRQTGYMQQE